jgi:CheY-like chemotaxis protein
LTSLPDRILLLLPEDREVRMQCEECGGTRGASGVRSLCATCRAELHTQRAELREQIRKIRALRAAVSEQTERSRTLNLRLALLVARMRSGLDWRQRPLIILVVDDDPAVRDSIRLLLEDLSAQVRTARDGEQALAVAQEAKPDLILTDLRMPGVDGWELVRRLRRLPSTRPTLVVAVSAYVSEEDAARLQAVGFDGWLAKPFHLDELRDVLATARRRMIA